MPHCIKTIRTKPGSIKLPWLGFQPQSHDRFTIQASTHKTIMMLPPIQCIIYLCYKHQGKNKAIMIFFAAQQKQQYHEICMRQSSLHTTIMTKPQCIKTIMILLQVQKRYRFMHRQSVHKAKMNWICNQNPDSCVHWGLLHKCVMTCGLVHCHDFAVATNHDMFMPWCCAHKSIMILHCQQHRDSLMRWCICVKYHDFCCHTK